MLFYLTISSGCTQPREPSPCLTNTTSQSSLNSSSHAMNGPYSSPSSQHIHTMPLALLLVIFRNIGFSPIGQTSRRSFLKWVGKAGLATATAIGGELALILPAFASINCSQYFPGRTGNCDCESCCTDPDYGVQRCAGNCSPCGQPQYFIVTSFWY